jgi:hypothetical protein
MNSKEKRKNTMSYLAFGLLIPLLLLILSEVLNNKVRTLKEAERLSSVDVLGFLKHVKSQDPTFARKKPRASYAEMLRNIRMRIEFKVMRKTNIAVAVTSTQSGDGKTFISTNLAAQYSMTGHPTLLIDMDIRKPDVHEKLGLEASIGVTNYLIGDCELDDIIIDRIRELKLNPETFNEIKKTDNSELINKEIAKIDAQISRFMDLYGIGTFSVEDIESKVSLLQDTKKKLENQLNESTTLPEKEAVRLIQSFDDILEHGTFEEIKAVIDALIDRIELDDDDITIFWAFS